MAEESLTPPTGEMLKPKLGGAILIGLVATLVLAAAYAALMIWTEHAWGWAMIAIGLVVGAVMVRAAGGATMAVGGLAAVLTAIGIVLAIAAATVGLVMKAFHTGLSDTIDAIDFVEAVKAFFEESAVRYVYAAAGIILALVVGAGLRNKSIGK